VGEKQWWWAAADYQIKRSLSMVTKKRKKVANRQKRSMIGKKGVDDTSKVLIILL